MAVTPAAPPGHVRRARRAVSALFFVNGFIYTNVVPWLPAIKESLSLSNVGLGMAIAALPLGAIATGMLAGPLIRRFGSGRAAVGSSLVAVGTLPIIAVVHHWWALAAALFVIGSSDSWADAAQNTHGLRVQRRYQRSVINTFHAVWSLAAMSGGLAGATAAGAGIPMGAHLGVVAAILVMVLLVARRHLLPGVEHENPPIADTHRTDGNGRRIRRPAASLLLRLSVLLMLAVAIEDTAAAWGAVYMTSELDATPFLAGMPFVAGQAAMAITRLVGDRVTERLGPVVVGRGGMLTAAAGLTFALLLVHPVTTIVGFALVGLGVATLFPLTMTAAGHIPGTRSGDAITIVSWIARMGPLVFPPVIGAVADASTLRAALWLVVAGSVVGSVLAGALTTKPHAGSGRL